MPMQTRRVQVMVTRNLRRRLAGGEASVDFRTLEMLACNARSTHNFAVKHSLINKDLIMFQEKFRPKVIRYRKISLLSDHRSRISIGPVHTSPIQIEETSAKSGVEGCKLKAGRPPEVDFAISGQGPLRR
jgi:hypothetical protein